VAAEARGRGGAFLPGEGQPPQHRQQAQDDREDHGIQTESRTPGVCRQILPQAGEPVGQCGEGMGHVNFNNSHSGGRQGIFSGRKSLLFVNKKKQKNFM
jgi:hypothetical protein